MTQLLIQYSYLQTLDFLTTVAFLLYGVQEGNPLVRWLMAESPSPLVGLLAVKVAAVVMGVIVWRLGRQRLLARVNVLFAIIVAWNLLALIAGQLAVQ